MAHERISATAMAAIPMSAPLPGARLPKNRVGGKATAGSDGTSQASRITGPPESPGCAEHSPFEQAHLVDVDRLAVAVDEDHDVQADADLRGGDRDDEQGEDLPTGQRVLEVLGERHQVDVHRVQHQLDRHQDEHGVSPRQHAVDAGREENAGEDEGKHQADHPDSSFRAITTAPTSAARSRTDTISKGST